MSPSCRNDGVNKYIFIVPRKEFKSVLDCKNRKNNAIQSAIKSFFEWISNPGAIHKNGMQSGFCNLAIAILMMPDYTLTGLWKADQLHIEILVN